MKRLARRTDAAGGPSQSQPQLVRTQAGQPARLINQENGLLAAVILYSNPEKETKIGQNVDQKIGN